MAREVWKALNRPESVGRGPPVETLLPGIAPAVGALPARIVIEVAEPDIALSGKLENQARHAVGGLFLRIRPLFRGANQEEDPYRLASYYVLELACTRGHIGAHGHDIAYHLVTEDGISRAEYEGAYLGFMPLGSVLGGGTPPQDTLWAPKAVKLFEAMQLPNFVPGTNIVVGQPDTGWVVHHEFDQAALDLARQWNTLTNSGDATDPQSFILFNGHGTASGSQIISAPAGQVHGLAPGARLIPIRCLESVVLIADIELAEAIWYAAQQGVDVLSISVGGYPASSVKAVLADAVHQKNILCSASAGNVVPWVVFPAAYPDCIAVAGTTPSDRPWKNSSWGPQVSISAPAHLVWVADFDQNKQPVVGPGSGTSFSAPHVAGAAALWLSYHGRQALVAMYAGQTPLQEVFRYLLKQTARNPGVFQTPGRPGEDVDASVGYSWENSRYGAGILDIHALLSAALPTPQEVLAGTSASTSLDWEDIIVGLVADIDPTLARRGLHSMFARFPEKELSEIERYGPEVAQLLMDNSIFRDAFRRAILVQEAGPTAYRGAVGAMSASLRAAIAG
ncbi:S8/S53 family peptidase [Mesorhizobium sp.]|uniref:S8 family peptidase n=1 Tax=Mesorhizobium sp. TaxID=1871066 RepID=UPI00258078F2|nr:S8/S53 family peptidase [Mesorhizobium sp.]